MIKAQTLSSITLKDTTAGVWSPLSPLTPHTLYLHWKKAKSNAWSCCEIEPKQHKNITADITVKVGIQAWWSIWEISIVGNCLRYGGGGEQIRELCPVRAQSAGGNASGKPLTPALTWRMSRPQHALDTRVKRSFSECQPADGLNPAAAEHNTGVNCKSVTFNTNKKREDGMNLPQDRQSSTCITGLWTRHPLPNNSFN